MKTETQWIERMEQLLDEKRRLLERIQVLRADVTGAGSDVRPSILDGARRRLREQAKAVQQLDAAFLDVLEQYKAHHGVETLEALPYEEQQRFHAIQEKIRALPR